MKKIMTIVGIALAMTTHTSSFAAATAITGSATGASAPLTSAECLLVAAGQTATIKLSQNVEAGYECTSTAAGVGTAHPGGKGKTYGASSNGGALLEGNSGEFATPAAARTAAGTAATTAMNAS